MPKILKWSQSMQDLFNAQVDGPVRKHPSTEIDPEGGNNLWMGYRMSEIRADVLEKGRADFCKGYGTLSADEKSLLYCFTNMRAHFYEALKAFTHYKTTLSPMFSKKQRTLVIDVGCGPATAGLALAACISRPYLRYFGVDRAPPMLSTSRAFLNGALRGKILAKGTTFALFSKWPDVIAKAKLINMPEVVVNATYLFASDSLKAENISKLIDVLRSRTKVRRIRLLFTNTPEGTGVSNYESFKESLKFKFKGTGIEEDEVTYVNNIKFGTRYPVGPVKFVRELLKIKG